MKKKKKIKIRWKFNDKSTEFLGKNEETINKMCKKIEETEKRWKFNDKSTEFLGKNEETINKMWKKIEETEKRWKFEAHITGSGYLKNILDTAGLKLKQNKKYWFNSKDLLLR